MRCPGGKAGSRGGNDVSEAIYGGPGGGGPIGG